MRLRAIGLGLALLLAACGGDDDAGAPTPPTPVNQPPQITSAATASVPENSAGAAYQASAPDPEANALTYSLGGADAALFTIAADGAVSFRTAPDFEAPADSGKDNVYAIQVIVSDGTNQVSKDVAITVTDAIEGLRPKLLAQYDDAATAVPIDDGRRVIVIERKTGRIWIKDVAVAGRGTVVATIANVSYSAGIGSSAPYGVLDAVAAPDFATSGVFYVDTSIKAGGGSIERVLDVRRYRLNADRTAVSAPEIVLRTRMPTDDAAIVPTSISAASGGMAFGPDGLLYLGTSLTPATIDRPRDFKLFGGILRLDVSRDDFPADPGRNYAIPASNPDLGPGTAREMITRGPSLFPRRLDFEGNVLFIADPTYADRAGGQDVFKIDVTRPPATLTDSDFAFGYAAVGQSYVTGGPVYRGPVAAYAGSIIFADVFSAVYAVPLDRVLAGDPPRMTRGDGSMTTVLDLPGVVKIAIDPKQNLYFVTLGPDGGLYTAEAY